MLLSAMGKMKNLVSSKQMSKYTQDFLDGFLKMEAEQREAEISEQERQLHLARQFCRYDKALKVCKSPAMQRMLEKAKQDLIKLMQRE